MTQLRACPTTVAAPTPAHQDDLPWTPPYLGSSQIIICGTPLPTFNQVGQNRSRKCAHKILNLLLEMMSWRRMVIFDQIPWDGWLRAVLHFLCHVALSIFILLSQCPGVNISSLPCQSLLLSLKLCSTVFSPDFLIKYKTTSLLGEYVDCGDFSSSDITFQGCASGTFNPDEEIPALLLSCSQSLPCRHHCLLILLVWHSSWGTHLVLM